MKNKDILYSVLLTTALAINPLVAKTVNSSAKHQTNTLKINIAKILHKRGIDDDAAKQISEDFFLDNEELFSMMLKNLENGCSILSEEEILHFISQLALQRKKIKLDSYASLVSMVQNIKNKIPSKDTLQELEQIATKNFLFSQYISTRTI